LRTAGCFELWPIVLREAVPKVTHLAVLWNPEAGGAEGRVKELRTATGVLNLTPHIFEARNANEFEGAFAAMARAHLGGLIVVPDPLTLRHRDQVVRLAAQTRLPATYGFPEFARPEPRLTPWILGSGFSSPGHAGSGSADPTTGLYISESSRRTGTAPLGAAPPCLWWTCLTAVLVAIVTVLASHRAEDFSIGYGGRPSSLCP